jgi:hypothetical protein
VKHLSGAPFYGRLLALPTNIRLGCKGLPGTNALAYYKNLLKSFIGLAPGRRSLSIPVLNATFFLLWHLFPLSRPFPGTEI